MNLTLIDNYVVESFFFQGPSCSVFEYFALNQPKRKGFNCSFDVKHVSVAQFLPKLQVKMSKTDITLVSNSSNHPLLKPMYRQINRNCPSWQRRLSTQGVCLQNSSTSSFPKWGPPQKFIKIQPSKRGPPIESINQRGSASRFHQPKRDLINPKGGLPLGTISMDLGEADYAHNITTFPQNFDTFQRHCYPRTRFWLGSMKKMEGLVSK